MKVKVTDGQLSRASMLGARKVVTALDIKRAYEKLRKRSYRRRGTVIDVGHEVYMPVWNAYDHMAYVQGVRDALNEISR